MRKKKSLAVKPFIASLTGIWITCNGCATLDTLNDGTTPSYETWVSHDSSYLKSNIDNSKPLKSSKNSSVSQSKETIIAVYAFSDDLHSYKKHFPSYLKNQFERKNILLKTPRGLQTKWQNLAKTSRVPSVSAEPYFKEMSLKISDLIGKGENDEAFQISKSLLGTYKEKLIQSYQPTPSFAKAVFWAAAATKDDPNLFKKAAQLYTSTATPEIARELEGQMDSSILAMIYGSSEKLATVTINNRPSCSTFLNGRKVDTRKNIAPSGHTSIITSNCGNNIYSKSFTIRNSITIDVEPKSALREEKPTFRKIRRELKKYRKSNATRVLLVHGSQLTQSLSFELRDLKSGKKISNSKTGLTSSNAYNKTARWISLKIPLAKGKANM